MSKCMFTHTAAKLRHHAIVIATVIGINWMVNLFAQLRGRRNESSSDLLLRGISKSAARLSSTRAIAGLSSKSHRVERDSWKCAMASVILPGCGSPVRGRGVQSRRHRVRYRCDDARQPLQGEIAPVPPYPAQPRSARSSGLKSRCIARHESSAPIPTIPQIPAEREAGRPSRIRRDHSATEIRQEEIRSRVFEKSRQLPRHLPSH